MRKKMVPLPLIRAIRNNQNFDSLTICVLVGAMSVLVDSVQIQLPSERLVGTHSGKVKRHDGLFESDLAVNLEGFAIGQPRDNVIETFSFDIFQKIIHLVGEVFGLPVDLSTEIGIAYLACLEGLLELVRFLLLVRFLSVGRGPFEKRSIREIIHAESI